MRITATVVSEDVTRVNPMCVPSDMISESDGDGVGPFSFF